MTSGFNGGAWNGTGIDTSDVNSGYGLGYADWADSGNPAKLSPDQIDIQYTLYGDANLDGVVNSADFGILANHYGDSNASWDEGDFNYDGKVDSADFGMLAVNYGSTASAADVDLTVANFATVLVPAPMALNPVLILDQPFPKASLTARPSIKSVALKPVVGAEEFPNLPARTFRQSWARGRWS